MINHPFDAVLKDADDCIEKGGRVFQKFECDKCGNVLTMDVPNTFYTSGSCDKCGHVTDIRKKGCNTMVVYGLDDPVKKMGEA